MASYLEARRHGGLWHVRIDDIDPPREQPGADTLILQALEIYGFEWDGAVFYQSQSGQAHKEAVDALIAAGQAYRCGCSRRDLADVPRGPLGTIYPGLCRDGTDSDDAAIRVLTTDEPISFQDRLQGEQTLKLESESGDFVILRRDGLIAYQIAVVVDDYLEGVTDIVRGIDLMPSTPRQIWLQQLLGYPTPQYAHIPIAVHEDGSKLSKLTGALGLPLDDAAATLVRALVALQQSPPPELGAGSIEDVWAWAGENWDMNVLQGVREVSTQSSTMA